MTAAIEVAEGMLTLRFPRPEFSDTHVTGYRATPTGARVERVEVVPWSADRVAAWHAEDRRWRRYGRRVAATLDHVRSDGRLDVYTRRIAARLGVPLRAPSKTTALFDRSFIDGAGWLDDGAAMIVGSP